MMESLMFASQMPSVTDWMQGWGSVIGAGLTLGAVVITGLLLLLELVEARRAREQAVEERAAAQVDRDQAAVDRALAEAERMEAKSLPARTVVVTDILRDTVDTQLRRLGAKVKNFGSGPILEVFSPLRDTASLMAATLSSAVGATSPLTLVSRRLSWRLTHR